MKETSKKILRINTFFGITGIAIILYAIFKDAIWSGFIFPAIEFIFIGIIIASVLLWLLDDTSKSGVLITYSWVSLMIYTVISSILSHLDRFLILGIGIAITVTTILILIIIIILWIAHKKEIDNMKE